MRRDPSCKPSPQNQHVAARCGKLCVCLVAATDGVRCCQIASETLAHLHISAEGCVALRHLQVIPEWRNLLLNTFSWSPLPNTGSHEARLWVGGHIDELKKRVVQCNVGLACSCRDAAGWKSTARCLHASDSSRFLLIAAKYKVLVEYSQWGTMLSPTSCCILPAMLRERAATQVRCNVKTYKLAPETPSEIHSQYIVDYSVLHLVAIRRHSALAHDLNHRSQ